MVDRRVDEQQIKARLIDALRQLSKQGGLYVETQFFVNALIEITLDSREIILISIKETIHPRSDEEEGLERHTCIDARGAEEEADRSTLVETDNTEEASGVVSQPELCEGLQSRSESGQEYQAQTQLESGQEYPAEIQPEIGQEYPAEIQPESGQEYPAEIQPESGQEYPPQIQPESRQEYLIQIQPESEQEYPAQIQPESEQEYPVQIQRESEQEYPAQIQPESEQEYPVQIQPESEQEYPVQIQPESEQEYPAQIQSESEQEYPAQIQSESEQEYPVQIQSESEQEYPAQIQPESGQEYPIQIQPESGQEYPEENQLESQQKYQTENQSEDQQNYLAQTQFERQQEIPVQNRSEIQQDNLAQNRREYQEHNQCESGQEFPEQNQLENQQGYRSENQLESRQEYQGQDQPESAQGYCLDSRSESNQTYYLSNQSESEQRYPVQANYGSEGQRENWQGELIGGEEIVAQEASSDGVRFAWPRSQQAPVEPNGRANSHLVSPRPPDNRNAKLAASEAFDDFDSTDLAIQLTEMAASRRQLLEASQQQASAAGLTMSSVAISQDGGTVVGIGNSFDGIALIAAAHESSLQQVTPVNSPQKQQQTIMSSPALTQKLMEIAARQAITSSASGSLPFSFPAQTAQLPSLGSTQRLQHASIPACFQLEDFLVAQSSQLANAAAQGFTFNAKDLNQNPPRVTLPLSFLPSCSFTLAAATTTPQAGTPIDKLDHADLVRLVASAPNMKDLTAATLPVSCIGALPSGIDFSALFAQEFRRSVAPATATATLSSQDSLVNVPTASIATTTSVVATPVTVTTTEDDGAAEALMQRMIEEGRLHGNKRQRTSLTPSKPLNTGTNIASPGTSAITAALVSRPDEVANIIAVANSCGINLSTMQSALKVKDEYGGGSDIDSSKQFDNLYLAYTAIQQAAAAAAAMSSASSQQQQQQQQLLDVKTSQNLLGIAAVSQNLLVSSATSQQLQQQQQIEGTVAGLLSAAAASAATISDITDNSTAEAQSAQTARLAMLQLQTQQPSRRYSVTGKTFHCLACGKALSSMHNLKLHEATVHRGLFQYRCPLCGKGLRQERDLRGHLANRHNMKKDFRCSICGNEFGYKRNLKQHMVSYHGWKDPVVQL